MASSSSEPTAMQKWINSETNKPNFARHGQENLEARTVAASELFVEGFYRTMKAASDALGVPYKRLRSRIQGHHPVSENGGNATLLGSEEEQEVLCWAHRRIAQGHHIQGRALQQHANAILKAKGRGGTASQKWAQRFMKRWGRYFHRRKAASRDVKRKAMQDRACVEAFFQDWPNFITRHDIRRENIWNFDETGFINRRHK
ncbi:tc5 transposase DNA-binding domain-containing protein [Hirsutella rhossiliensis]|uniref:Tc5 transposase DNA-binding domain-containing protein n=1 Tax=Hirsutella rhossiliensis TaxID=111463 RepID=A0A9P8SC01_9HYPO|nr:tc5 transposase DNA-binding domain-containing protein [Hirsutella rhossiliensis]KAH0957031.1 tc5 transposase DNA-binding domain-containing protein [Hirsutella rhossiliensis]